MAVAVAVAQLWFLLLALPLQRQQTKATEGLKEDPIVAALAHFPLQLSCLHPPRAVGSKASAAHL